ncbi:hydroxymethylpyrimidine/phosphomethylpyrimidine kinase [Flavitalea flava]
MDNFLKKNNGRPTVLVIAGYDQSGGAGLLADIKTLEAHIVYGYGVCTGLTFQNERTITRIHWFDQKEIFEQIDLCFQSTGFDAVKIGIGRSPGMIYAITRHLRQHDPHIRIVWDPVIRASSGKDFWEQMDVGGFESIAQEIFLLTPNREEIGWLYPGEDVRESCQRLFKRTGCHLYLKGGHDPENPGTDYLWGGSETETEVTVFEPAVENKMVYPKHGSGCVLASAFAANLALGYTLPEAAGRAKRYIEQYLVSNKSLLGWHKPLTDQVS